MLAHASCGKLIGVIVQIYLASTNVNIGLTSGINGSHDNLCREAIATNNSFRLWYHKGFQLIDTNILQVYIGD